MIIQPGSTFVFERISCFHMFSIGSVSDGLAKWSLRAHECSIQLAMLSHLGFFLKDMWLFYNQGTNRHRAACQAKNSEIKREHASAQQDIKCALHCKWWETWRFSPGSAATLWNDTRWSTTVASATISSLSQLRREIRENVNLDLTRENINAWTSQKTHYHA